MHLHIVCAVVCTLCVALSFVGQSIFYVCITCDLDVTMRRRIETSLVCTSQNKISNKITSRPTIDEPLTVTARNVRRRTTQMKISTFSSVYVRCWCQNWTPEGLKDHLWVLLNGSMDMLQTLVTEGRRKLEKSKKDSQALESALSDQGFDFWLSFMWHGHVDEQFSSDWKVAA